MNNLMIMLTLVSYSFGLHSNKLSNTKGSNLFRVIPEDHKQLAYLQNTLASEVADFWTLPRQIGDRVDFMILDWMVPVMKNMLNKNDIRYKIIDINLEKSILKHLQDVKEKEGKEMDWKTYYPYEKILTWMNKIGSEFPSLVTVKTLGQTFEGNDLKVVMLSTGEKDKPIVWINGGIYGREWISTATATFLINSLLRNEHSGVDLLKDFDFYIVPVANPDGYIYSWSDVRLWSKTRSDPKLRHGCIGVDPNRNWDITWNEPENTTNLCADNYPGGKPFSEIETEVLRQEMLTVAERTSVFLSLQAYGQKWLSACSYSGKQMEKCENLDALGKEAASASSAVNGRIYEYIDGSPFTYDYSMSGTSVEWAKFEAGIDYSYVIELPDTGNTGGYLLPPDNIISVGEDTIAGLSKLLSLVKNSRDSGDSKTEL